MTHLTFNILITVVALMTLIAFTMALYYFTLGGDHESQ